MRIGTAPERAGSPPAALAPGEDCEFAAVAPAPPPAAWACRAVRIAEALRPPLVDTSTITAAAAAHMSSATAARRRARAARRLASRRRSRSSLSIAPVRDHADRLARSVSREAVRDRQARGRRVVLEQLRDRDRRVAPRAQ